MAKDAAEAQAKEREARQQAWKRKVGDAGIPERFRDRSLENFVVQSEAQSRALGFAKSYADNFSDALLTGRSALFLGKPGTGKTHLAAAISMQIMQRDGRTVLFSSVIRAVRRVKDTWGNASRETESEAIAGLASPDLLILDEVGVQFGSETEKLIVFDVLNERYEKRRPVLLLSNLTIDGVRDFLGDRILDRLREDGGEVIPFAWESHRGRK